MFAFLNMLFAMLTNFVSGTNKFVGAYSEAGTWCEDSMKGFNSVASVERDIKLTKLRRQLEAEQAQLSLPE